MKTASAKAKGRNLQNHVVQSLLNTFRGLTELDVRSTPMGCTGSDVTLSQVAQNAFPYDVECKAQESLSIWAALKQSEERCPNNLKPLLVFKRNRSDVYCAMKFSDFLTLIEESINDHPQRLGN